MCSELQLYVKPHSNYKQSKHEHSPPNQGNQR